MIRTILITILLFASGLSSGADVNQLRWMAGCWALNGQEAGSGEIWMLPAGGSMLGMSRIVRDGKTVAFEYLRVATIDANIALFASPSGQNTTQFKLSILQDREVVFENLGHDFPQRITYRLETDSLLFASISGTQDGVARKIDFPMTKTSCVNNSEANQDF